jgi:tyrosyl-tRNA synthetase
METGLSFIEFNYQLLQSYDFLVLHDRHNCLLQIGGNDQWGNIVSGSDLIRRVRGRETFGLTSPLVTRADGQKMGKTEQGAIFLDPEMCSPYEFFQYWRNVPDQDVARFLKLYTFLPVEEIQRLANLKDKEINQAKEILARELTTIVHGADEANRALQAARAAFQKSDADASALPQMEISQAELESGLRAVDLFSRTELCSSKGEARRLIEQGGARVNEAKVPDIETVLDRSWLSENELLLRAGKKRYFRVIVLDE